jgi:SAM-dependent methyltransferase
MLNKSEKRGVGVDLSPHQVTSAVKNGATALVADARALPFRSARFGSVLSHLAFSVMGDLDAVLAEVHRVLSPSGVFATVIGGGPRLGSSYELFVDLAAKAAEGPSLMDPALRREDSLRSLFAPHFSEVTVEDFYIEVPREDERAFFESQYERLSFDDRSWQALWESYQKMRPPSARCEVFMRLLQASL